MDLKKKVEIFKRKNFLRKNKTEINLAESYLRRARNNLAAMQIDYSISNDKNILKILNLSDFKEYDWVIVKGYYAMYMAALACLAKIGLKSESHETTIVAIEFYFVESGKLEKDYIGLIKDISLERDFIESLREHAEKLFVEAE